MSNWTQADLDAHQKRRQTATTPLGATIPAKAGKRAKYGNKAVTVDLRPDGELVNGHLRLAHTFDSQREADYFAGLKLRRQAGEVVGLQLQRAYPLIARARDGGMALVGEYLADFEFWDAATGTQRTVDVKGVKTAVYALKKKIAEACHDIVIEEV